MNILLNQPLKPNLSKLTNYLEKVNESGWYTNFGVLHQELTQRLEDYLGVENLLLVSNGTLALQVAYKTLNTKKALTTPFSFVATTSSLLWQNIETSFSDIDPRSYNLDPCLVEKVLSLNTDIDTVVATHVYGNPCDIEAFKTIAEKYGVNVVYDAAHAFGVKVNGESLLSYGDASILSFHATKVFHTVEGGAVVFKNRSDYERAKRLINFGMGDNGVIIEAGINAKLNEYQCAVGLAILDELDSVIEHRSNLFNLYRDGLFEIVEIQEWYHKASFNGAYMPVCFKDEAELNLVKANLSKKGIQFRTYFSPSLDLIFTDNVVHSSNISNEVSGKVLCLPLHAYLTVEDVGNVIESIREVLK